MSEGRRVAITTLPTGVPGLDDILGGGLPEYSFNLLAGVPGAGKTTLAHQLMFALATPARPALYITVVGEPALKLLRYQQQFAFFDPAMVGDSIRYVDLTALVQGRDPGAVLAEIVRQVAEIAPGLVVVDSFQAMARAAGDGLDLQEFVQDLAIHLTGWQATTFLLGEDVDAALLGSPVFTVADGIIRLSQAVDGNSVVRKLQVLKSRGQAPMPGLHTVNIDAAGLRVYPRMSIARAEEDRAMPTARLASGVPGLDALLGGGVPAGDTVLVSGPSGAGKSVLAAQFIAAGESDGEPGVIAVFEEHPREYLRRAAALGLDLPGLVDRGLLEIIYLRPLDLSPDETLAAIREAVARTGARRVAIDSLAGFELALAPGFRSDFRESLYRLVGALTGTGVTVLLTMEIVQEAGTLRFSASVISFLADTIILLRYAELAGELRTSLAVIKMRNSAHSRALWAYEITGGGAIVRGRLPGGQEPPPAPAGLTGPEATVLAALLELGVAPTVALARRTGLAAADLAAALDRLVAVGYAARDAGAGEAAYRPVARGAGG
jgi:circadian clock protein KaiC